MAEFDSFADDDTFGDDLFGDDELPDATTSPLPQDLPMTDLPNENDELGVLLKEGGIGQGFNLDDLNDHDQEFDQGDKLETAIDYGDLSDDDDDLPDEVPRHLPPQHLVRFLDGIETIPADTDLDDLFDGPSSPVLAPNGFPAADPVTDGLGDADSDLASEHEGATSPTTQAMQTELDDIDDAQYRTQMALFASSGKGYAPVTEQENIEQWLNLEYPQFKRDQIPFFSRLFPPKPLKWVGKVPAKPPKPVRPTKVNLEIDQDQKAIFNSSAAPTKSWDHENGVTIVNTPAPVQEHEYSSDDSDLDEPLPGGVTMQDLDFICADFDTLSMIAGSDGEVEDLVRHIAHDNGDLFGFDDFNDFDHPAKKRKLGLDPRDIVSIHHLDMPSFDNPERLTKKIAQKVVLDLNDPELLVEEVDPETIRSRVRPGEAKSGTKSVKEMLKGRFSTSNDTEYDLLKQNHQHKVRGQLGHMSIDHSVPALRLQWPYYQVKLPINEARTFHRARLQFKHYAFSFSKPAKLKRKHMKGKSTREIYSNTKGLSLGDNSTALLLEYSEEHPMMLSRPGMGNKVVNYYRRKAKDDTSRPKLDVGETSVLLPEDKSPFYMFGHVDPGETVSAIYNSMYRAPIYQQDVRPQDFLVTRETTHTHGHQYHIRKVDHIYVVGQELPSVTVPGPHSRFVTTAAKNRLKAISFRIARRKKSHRLRVEDVTKHFPDTTDMQNRQKMKEFMVFSKEHKEWEMKPGEPVPEEDQIQTLIRPEDVCLLEAMQVGQQYLLDAGFAEDDDDDDEDGKEKQGLSIEQELAPWKTSKNFLHATQGKAMLTLHGDGDPSGRGEGFSFIKTSMKGGFKAQGASVQDKMSEKKELGGHSYNVARQQRAYEEAIRKIWDAQKGNLELKTGPSDFDMDDGVDGQEDSFNAPSYSRPGARSGTNTPAPSRRHDDETGTSFSKRSTTSQTQKFLKIVRDVVKNGKVVREEVVETNPAVIKQYLRIRNMQEVNGTDLHTAVPTGDAEFDARQKQRLEQELARLEKNRERRYARDRAKGLTAPSPAGTAMSPDGTEPQTPATGGGKQQQATQRKCANCGQVGHIKTNKKLCPMLNGTIKQEDGFNNAAFMGAPPPSMS